MKAESGGSVEGPGKAAAGSAQQEARTCPICGTKFFATAESGFCPVCILNRAFGPESKATGEAGSVSGSASSPGDTEGTPQVRRFEHYEVMLDEAGRPIELGRGAMGVTYKALDVDLHCPVTLKVISERYLGDESAQLRFLREARAAAKVRHSNVASVLHLGRTGSSYFYAMEFVEGETLEHLIRGSGRVEVKLALEILAQVTAGLAAVHEQGSSGETSSADEFVDAALDWFGDPEPRIGTAWEKGERLARIVAHRSSRAKRKECWQVPALLFFESRRLCFDSC